MIISFGNRVAFDIFHDGESKKIPREFWRRAVHLLDVMDAVDVLDELKTKGFPPSIRLHTLKGARKGEFAIDINKLAGWRITFKFEDSIFFDVKIENYH